MKRYYTVFVYGTLRKGFDGFDRFLKNAKFLGKGKIKGFMYHTMSGYPAVIVDKDGDEICGEVYQVDSETIENLRKYEGVGSFLTCYEEVVLKITMDDGMVRIGRSFVVSPFNKGLIKMFAKKVPDGDWAYYLTNPPKKKRKLLIVYLWIMVNLFIFVEVIYALHK